MNEDVRQPEIAEPKRFGPSEHNISRSQIDPDALKVVLRLVRSGYDAYIVGGGVRDLLLGKTPKDFDISTSATPKDIKHLFRNCRIIGRRFKLAHVYFANGKTLEVSTFRDSVDWSENPDAAENSPLVRDNLYGSEATDALRRDLTINGLFFDCVSSTIIDYVDGIHDLRSGIIRVIGDPLTRFQEDPVRMIRVVRHSARTGFQIEPNCWKTLLANCELISQSVPVRVFDELKKDLCSGQFLTILSLLAETRLLEFVLPELLENNAALLSAESDLSVCLERVDELVLSGYNISPTTVLASLALFMAADTIKLADLPFQFDGSGDIQSKLNACFTLLAVPRKEKERITLLLSSWLKVAHSPLESLKSGALRRLALLEDLAALLRITESSSEDSKKLRIIEHALHSRNHNEEDLPPHRRSRRGN